MERWKSYRGTCYSVSSFASVRNERTGRILRPSNNGQDIWYVKLNFDEGSLVRSLARMVAEVWRNNTNQAYNSVIHLDGDRGNCIADNLMWRPRNIALEYHRQFRNKTREVEIVSPFIELTSKRIEAFENLAEAGRVFGVLDRTMTSNLLGNYTRHLRGLEPTPAMPTEHIFVYL